MAGLDFEWFANQVARMSRQTLTTMGKPVGLKPHRRHGAWFFRDASGDEVTLAQTFNALQRDARGQQWLRDAYEAPARFAESARLLQHQREQQLLAEIRAHFDFLIPEFGYGPPFSMPVRIKDRLILAYRNPAAARQVEVSGDPWGYRTHCEIRRLIDGEPAEYGPHSVGEWELRMVLQPGEEQQESFERVASLRDSALLLRQAADILRGRTWIARDVVDRVVERRLFGQWGMSRPEPEAMDQLFVPRQLARFLVEQHGFILEFDSETLSPHEWEMWSTLRYRRGDTTIEIVNGDFRMPNEWTVRLNDEIIASNWTGDFEAGLRRALAEVARRLSRPEQ